MDGVITSLNTTSHKMILKVSGGNAENVVANTYNAS